MTSRAEPRRIPTGLVLGLILLLAAGLRLWHLGLESFWLDEFFSIECTLGHNYGQLALPRDVPIPHVIAYTDPGQARPWWTVPGSLDHDLHPPLAYLMMRGWCALFGYSETAVRSLSVMASLTGIGLLFLVGRRLHGPTPALWACLLMALAQPQIEFAQEAKHYALLVAWSLAALAWVLRIQNRGANRTRCAVLLTLALAALFTHYYAAEALMVLIAYALLRLRGTDRRRVAFTLLAAFAIFALTWGPVILRQARTLGHDADFMRDTSQGHLWHTFERFTLIPMRLLSEPPTGWEWPARAGAILLLILPFSLLRRRPDLLVWALWLPAVIVPSLLIDLRSGTWALALMRYSLLAGPAVYCTLAALGTHLRIPALRIALPLIAAVSCALALPEAYRPRKANWRTFGTYLKEHLAPGDAVVFADRNDPNYGPMFYFIGTSHYAGPLPGDVCLLTHPADAALLQRLRQFPRVWLVCDTSDPQDFLPGAIAVEGKLMPTVGSIMRVNWKASERGVPAAKPGPEPIDTHQSLPACTVRQTP